MGLARAAPLCLIAFTSSAAAQYSVSPVDVRDTTVARVEQAVPLEQADTGCDIPEYDGDWHGRSDAEEWLPGFYPNYEPGPGLVAITFDDGPMGEQTEAILDVLATYGLPVTFFVVGRKIDETSFQLVQRMVAEGHHLGNHSYHHDTRMYGVDHRDDPHGYMVAQFALAQAMVDIALIAESSDDFSAMRDELLGEYSPRVSQRRIAEAWPEMADRHEAILARRTPAPHRSPYPMLYMRPPGGSPYYGNWSRRGREVFGDAVSELGVLNVMWTHSTHDSSGDRSSRWRHDTDRLAGQFEAAATEGGILLAHDRIDPDGLVEGLTRITSDPEVEVVTLDTLAAGSFDCAPGRLDATLRGEEYTAPEPDLGPGWAGIASALRTVVDTHDVRTSAAADGASLRIALATETGLRTVVARDREALALEHQALVRTHLAATRGTAWETGREAGLAVSAVSSAIAGLHVARGAVIPDARPSEVVPTVSLARTSSASGTPGTVPASCGAAIPGFSCVPGGWFERGVEEDDHRCRQGGQPGDGRASTIPGGLVWIDTFYMAITETTNAAYADCAERDLCEEAGARYWDFRAPEQPITGLTWYEARNYCERVGGHLPSEAEWELAARGPAGDLAPWGDEPATCEVAVIRDDSGRSCGVERRGSSPESGRVLEPCTRGPHRYGLCDMIGNAEEWVADAWTEDWEECGEDCAGIDPRGPCGGDARCSGHPYRVARGSSWYYDAEHATGFHRRRHRPGNDPVRHIGFRCALSVDEARALSATVAGAEPTAGPTEAQASSLLD